MKKNIFVSAIMFLCFFSFVFAVNTENVGYPIAELGNCANKVECATFCNKAENMNACIAYGEKNGMMTAEEVKISKVVANKVKEGKMPGGCTDKNSCETFCQTNLDSLSECLSFADEVGISGATIEEGKKVAKALKEGAKLPGNCKSKTECETFCADPNNIEACLDFGEASGIIDKQELSQARSIMKFIKSGETPGSCKRKSDCDVYCKDDSHWDECLAFAEKAGFLSGEELEMVKKTGGKGPGNCKGKEECAAYCENPSHLDECVEFGAKTGMISEDEVEKIKGGVQMIKDGLEQIPSEARSEAEACLEEAFNGKLSEVLSGNTMITKDQGNKVGPCMEKAVENYIKSQMPKEGQMPSQGGAPEGFQIPQGGMPENIPQGMPENVKIPEGVQIPSGLQGPPCSSPEECMKMFGPKQ